MAATAAADISGEFGGADVVASSGASDGNDANILLPLQADDDDNDDDRAANRAESGDFETGDTASASASANVKADARVKAEAVIARSTPSRNGSQHHALTVTPPPPPPPSFADLPLHRPMAKLALCANEVWINIFLQFLFLHRQNHCTFVNSPSLSISL